MAVSEHFERHLTIFVDLLGFRETIADADDTRRLQILALLTALSQMKSDFDISTRTHDEGSKSVLLKPAITTFSDNIVISYPLELASKALGPDPAPLFLLSMAARLIGALAAHVLALGFLVRGGATIGPLYHAAGVVFGEAMVEAYEIESRTAIFPRVVLSPQITSLPGWVDSQNLTTTRDADGLWRLDLPFWMASGAAQPGDGYTEKIKAWFLSISQIIEANLRKLEGSGNLNAYSKWAWFASNFRASLERVNPEILKGWGDPLAYLPVI